MWFFSVFCFCHVMAWMVDCFSFYKLTPPKVTHSPGLDFWLFSMFSHLASPSLPPFFCIISRILVFYPPLGWSVVRQVPQLSRSPLETCQHCPPFFGGGALGGHACLQVRALSVRRTGDAGFVCGAFCCFVLSFWQWNRAEQDFRGSRLGSWSPPRWLALIYGQQFKQFHFILYFWLPLRHWLKCNVNCFACHLNRGVGNGCTCHSATELCVV